MRKWEELYQDYKSGKVDMKIKFYEANVAGKTAKKEEIEELKRMKKIKANIDKVTNILELRDKLMKQQKDIKDEMARISELHKINEESKKIEEEFKKIDGEQDKILEELKNPALSDAEKKSKQARLSKLKSDMQENNKKYRDNQQKLADHSKSKNAKLSRYNEEDLKKKSFEIGTKISKCNMVANNLMKGASWNSIEVKLDNWDKKTYKSAEKITEKAEPVVDNTSNKTKVVDNTSDKAKAVDESDIEPSDSSETIDIDGLSEKIEKATEEQFSREDLRDLLTVPTFEQKHPRLAKIQNFFSKGLSKVKRLFRPNSLDEQEDATSIKIDEKEDATSVKIDEKDDKTVTKDKTIEKDKIGEEDKVDERDEFKKYLKEVAEKGMKTVAKERKEQAQKQAYEREKQKFGKEYAEKSYHMEDGNER